MLHTHVDTEGRKVLIAELDDEALLAVVDRAIGRLEDLGRFIAEDDDGASDYLRALYNVPKMDRRIAGITSRQAIEELYPYLAELWLRSLEEDGTLRERLSAILGREGQAQMWQGQSGLLLQSGRREA